MISFQSIERLAETGELGSLSTREIGIGWRGAGGWGTGVPSVT